MEDLALGRIPALVSEFAVKDLPLGRTLMMIMVSAGNGAINAGASLRPPVYRRFDLFMHCGCAELISECQLLNGMDIYCLFRERI